MHSSLIESFKCSFTRLANLSLQNLNEYLPSGIGMAANLLIYVKLNMPRLVPFSVTYGILHPVEF